MISLQELDKFMYSNTRMHEQQNEQQKTYPLEKINLDDSTITYKATQKIDYKIYPNNFITVDKNTNELIEYFIESIIYNIKTGLSDYNKKYIKNKELEIINYKISIVEINNKKYIITKNHMTYNNKTFYLGYLVQEYNDSFKSGVNRYILYIHYEIDVSKYKVTNFFLEPTYFDIVDEYSEIITYLKNLLKNDGINNYNDIYDKIAEEIKLHNRRQDEEDSEDSEDEIDDSDVDDSEDVSYKNAFWKNDSDSE
jgi:hypothetical protein